MSYIPPTPAEARTLIRALGLTGREVGELLAVSPRTVRRWQSESNDYTPMPYACLALLVGRALRPMYSNEPNVDWRLVFPPDQWRMALTRIEEEMT